jgi:hypothetical protein
MEKVVPFFISFKTIFSSNFFDLRKVLFGSVKVLNDLNLISFHLNSNLNQTKLPPPGTVVGAHSAATLPPLSHARCRGATHARRLRAAVTAHAAPDPSPTPSRAPQPYRTPSIAFPTRPSPPLKVFTGATW